jgi:hypothetical protein
MKEDSSVKQSQSELRIEIAKTRFKLFATLIIAASACTTLTFFPPYFGEVFYSNVLAVGASGSAFAISLQVVDRQKVNGLFPRLYASLGLALGLWFIAEATWMYYELIAGIETPTPSIADGFWLAGYVPFFYFLVGILRNFAGPSKTLLVPILLVSAGSIVLLANLVYSISQAADLTDSEGILTYLVNAAYPIADVFLIVPALAAFIQLRKGKLTFTPWAFIVTATIIFIIADIGFAYFIVMGLDDTIWIWNPLFILGDLAIASSLFWHREFYTMDEKKLTRNWQEKNR